MTQHFNPFFKRKILFRERLDDMIKKHRVDLEEVKAKYSHKMRMVLDEWSDEKLKYEEEAAVFKHMYAI